MYLINPIGIVSHQFHRNCISSALTGITRQSEYIINPQGCISSIPQELYIIKPVACIETDHKGRCARKLGIRLWRRFFILAAVQRANGALRMKCGPAPLAEQATGPKLELRSYVQKRNRPQGSVSFLHGGGSWIRTSEVSDHRFTVCPLWPLGNSPMLMELVIGVEPTTC